MSTTRPISLSRRRSQVFVSVPESPYKTPRSRHDHPSTSNSPPSSSSLKENTPLRPSRTNSDLTTLTSMSSLGSPSLKRKLSMSGVVPEVVITTMPPKKAKTASTTTQVAQVAPKKKSRVPTGDPVVLYSEKYPEGYFYCHQCNKQHSIHLAIRCTVVDGDDGHRCRARYCSRCLGSRYGQNFDEKISDDGSTLSKSEKAGHISDAGYYWKCPKCDGNCNCTKCRKLVGLPALGKIPQLAAQSTSKEPTKAKVQSKAKVSKDSKASTSKPTTSTKRLKAVVELSSPSKSKIAPAPKTKVAPKPKPLPKPLWTRLDLLHPSHEVEDRIAIREFFLRFAHALGLQGRKNSINVDELEELEGGTLSSLLEGDDHNLAGWVSDSCVSGMIAGLLNAIASDHSVASLASLIRKAAHAIEQQGTNLTAVWATLESLEVEIEESDVDFRFDLPEPLPAPASITQHNTRRAAKAPATNYHIACSAQLVPLVSYLIELTMSTPTIRDALDHDDARKEFSELARVAINQEKTNWQETKDTPKVKQNLKENRAKHKERLNDLEHSMHLVLQKFTHRFGPLGRDSEGRVYYALSPGRSETKAAEELIGGKVARVKLGRGKGGITLEDRKSMQRWSWFLAVKGDKPEGAVEAPREDETAEDLVNLGSESWWGFWDPAEIRKVAEWLEIKHGLSDGSAPATNGSLGPVNGSSSGKGKGKSVASRSTASTSAINQGREPSPLSDLSADESADTDDEEEDPIFALGKPTKKELHTLVKGLRQYADMLEWRVQRASAADDV